MFSTVLSIVVPLFGIMVVGTIAGHLKLIDRSGSAVLSRFVFMIAFPALVFVELRKVPLEQFFDWRFLGVLGGGMFATFCVGLLIARMVFHHGKTAQSLHALTAMYSSTAYIGLPIVLVAFGDRALVPGIVGAVITGVVFLPLAIVLAEFDQAGRTKGFSFAPLLQVLRNPVLIATAAGLLTSASGATVPAQMVSLCETLGAAFVPCALFSAGLFVSGGIEQTAKGEIAWLVFAKLALHPIITWWLAYHVFVLDHTLAAIAILQAALPAGVPVFVLAQQYGQFESRSNAAIVVSTALSVLTLTLLLVFLVPTPS